MKKVAFIDRDGTLIVGPRLLKNNPPLYEEILQIEQLQILPGAIEGLRILRDAGYELVMVSNQAGLGSVGFPEEGFLRVQTELLRRLSLEGIVFSRIYICPHLALDQCTCRKPKTGLVDRYRSDEAIDIKRSLMIGDRETDATFAQAIGVKFIRAGSDTYFPKNDIETFLSSSPLSMKKASTTSQVPRIPLYKNAELSGTERRRIFMRAQANIDSVMPDVRSIIDAIKNGGDAALVEYVQRFDKKDFDVSQIRVEKDDIAQAYKDVAPATLALMKRQIDISRNFHQQQANRIYAEADWSIEYVPGVRTGVRKGPIDNVGLYVPAGKAPLPTVSQILTVAAKAARVPRICVFFPPTNYYPEIIVAADFAGADEIYRVGGVAAIAAMAYGTESIKRVDKIAGPGSPWVQAAKLQVFGQVGIDMLSGPSEGLGMIDDSANPAWVAADILARSEHGPDSCFPIVTTSPAIANAIVEEVIKQAPQRSRYEQYIKPALGNGYQAIILVDTVDEMIAVANEYGAEHLHIQMRDAQAVSTRIRNAGSIFIGSYAPVPVGDYASGTNHCLPTSRAVAYGSPVGPETFMKNNEYQIITREGLASLAPIVRAISDVEGLDAHKEAVDIRLRS